MQDKPRYDWKKTAAKFAKQCAYIAIALLGVHYGNSAWYMAIAPSLTAIENIVKYA